MRDVKRSGARANIFSPRHLPSVLTPKTPICMDMTGLNISHTANAITVFSTRNLSSGLRLFPLLHFSFPRACIPLYVCFSSSASLPS